MNQAQLGSKIGYTHVAVSEWETGKKPVSMAVLIRLAELFNVDITYFLTELAPKGRETEEASRDTNKWENIAESLAKSLILREENEKRRIELVEAVEAQARLKQAEAQADRAKTDKLAYEELKGLLTELKASLGQDSRNEKAETADDRKSLVNE